MPLTPAEALEKNKGKTHLQLARALRNLVSEVEDALEYYTGDPIYVGLSAYLQYKVEADIAKDAGPITLRIIDHELHEHFGSYGWKIGIVTNSTESCHWAKLIDGRER